MQAHHIKLTGPGLDYYTHQSPILENLATGTTIEHFTNGKEGTITIYDKSKVDIHVIDNGGTINLAWLLMMI